MLISIGKFNVTFSTTFFFTQLNKASLPIWEAKSQNMQLNKGKRGEKVG
jgi:hypothetical protein